MVLERAPRLPSEPVPLREARGRVLAEPAVAVDDVPGLRQLGDGRVRRPRRRLARRERRRAAGLAGGRRVARRPSRFRASSSAGEAIAISTGAVVPAGADAVIRVEDTRREGDEVSLMARGRGGTEHPPGGRGHPGRRAGARRRGSPSAPPRSASSPRSVTPRSSAPGVRPWPCCSPATSWSSPGAPLGPGQIRDSNAYSVPPLAEAAGAELASVEIAGDDREATREALERALGGRRGRRLRRRLGRRARPRPPGARGARRRAALLGRRAAAREADLLRGRPGRDAGLRPARQPGLGDGHLRALRPAGAAASCRAPIRPGSG